MKKHNRTIPKEVLPNICSIISLCVVICVSIILITVTHSKLIVVTHSMLLVVNVTATATSVGMISRSMTRIQEYEDFIKGSDGVSTSILTKDNDDE